MTMCQVTCWMGCPGRGWVRQGASGWRSVPSMVATWHHASHPPALPQALCCMSPGCAYATIKRDEKTTDYIVYKETKYCERGWGRMEGRSGGQRRRCVLCSVLGASERSPHLPAAPSAGALEMSTALFQNLYRPPLPHVTPSPLMCALLPHPCRLLLPHVQQRHAEGQ